MNDIIIGIGIATAILLLIDIYRTKRRFDAQYDEDYERMRKMTQKLFDRSDELSRLEKLKEERETKGS